MKHRWSYPTIARYHSAAAALAASEANLPHFLERAMEDMSESAIFLAHHNIHLYNEDQANCIAWASRD